MPIQVFAIIRVQPFIVKNQLGKAAANEEIILRFDSLNSIGRVWLNGQEVSTVWCTPWEANLTPFVKNGENKLEIEVVTR